MSCWKPKGGLGPYLGHQGRPPPRRGFQNLSQSASEHLQAVSKCLSSKAPSFGTGGSHSRPLWWLFGKNDSRQTAYSLKWNRPNWGQLQTSGTGVAAGDIAERVEGRACGESSAAFLLSPWFEFFHSSEGRCVWSQPL